MDREALPVSKLAGLCAGLPEESRTKMRISGAKLTLDQALLAKCYDALQAIIWQNGGGNGPRPESILTVLLSNDEKPDIVAFDSPEAFERAYMALRKEI